MNELLQGSRGEAPKSRRWFVVLACVTLVVFGLFVAGITIVTAALPRIRKARQGAVATERVEAVCRAKEGVR